MASARTTARTTAHDSTSGRQVGGRGARRRAALRASVAGAGALTLAFALAACSGGSEPTQVEATDSPLSKYYEELYPTGDPAEQAKRQAESEDLVAACMADEGFEYQPVDNSSMSTDIDDIYKDYGSREFAEKYGFGMFVGMSSSDEQPQDPNADYVESLSESEMTAYYEVLYGPGVGEDETYDWTKGGCQGAAQHEVFPEYDLGNDEKHAALFERMSAVYEDAEKDPKVVEAAQKWSDCMADAGYTGLKTRSDASNSINEEMNALYSSSDGTEATEPDDAALDEVKKKEIEAAVTDWDCNDSTKYEDTRLKAQFALEEQFITDNKAELDELLATAAQGGE